MSPADFPDSPNYGFAIEPLPELIYRCTTRTPGAAGVPTMGPDTGGLAAKS
jgi:hypothetical protein